MKIQEPKNFAPAEFPEHGPPEEAAVSSDSDALANADETLGDWPRGAAEIERLLAAAEQALAQAVEPVIEPEPFAWRDLTAEESSGEEPASGDPGDSVRLRVEIGRAALDTAELRRLQRGGVVPLAATVTSPVAIYHGSRIVARGELLVHDRRFCVRITEVVASPVAR